jgi:hypothetical protein
MKITKWFLLCCMFLLLVHDAEAQRYFRGKVMFDQIIGGDVSDATIQNLESNFPDPRLDASMNYLFDMIQDATTNVFDLPNGDNLDDVPTDTLLGRNWINWLMGDLELQGYLRIKNLDYIETNLDFFYNPIVDEFTIQSLGSNISLWPESGVIVDNQAALHFKPNSTGDKIFFYDTAYKMSISPYHLDLTSDLNFGFHSDTVPNLMRIVEPGDVYVLRDFFTGRDITVNQDIHVLRDIFADRDITAKQLNGNVSNATIDDDQDKFTSSLLKSILYEIDSSTIDTDGNNWSLVSSESIHGASWVDFKMRDVDVYGDINVQCAPLTFKLFSDGNHAIIRSDVDLYLDPSNNGVAGAVIVPCTVMEFPDFLGDKIRFYDTAYKIGVSAFTLDLTSDQDFKFHSDTVSNLMRIAEPGDVYALRDISAGRDITADQYMYTTQYRFKTDGTGKKIDFGFNAYDISLNPGSLDFRSDQYFSFGSDENPSSLTIDGDTGASTIPIVSDVTAGQSIPSNSIYFVTEESRLGINVGGQSYYFSCD